MMLSLQGSVVHNLFFLILVSTIKQLVDECAVIFHCSWKNICMMNTMPFINSDLTKQVKALEVTF